MASRPRIRRNGSIYYPRLVGEMPDVEFYARARENFQHVLLAGPPGTGKCFTEDNYVLDAVTGSKRSVKEIVEEGGEGKVMGVDLVKSKITALPILKAFNNGRRHCYTITLTNGRRTTVTDNHPFLTRYEWKTARELRAGTPILAPLTLPEPPQATPAPLGHIDHLRARLTEDGVCDMRLTEFTNSDLAQLTDPIKHPVTVNTYNDADTLADIYARLGQATIINKDSHAWTVTPTGRAEKETDYLPIDSITPAGVQQTYGLSIDTWHNHIVNGILSHNTAGLEAAFDAVNEGEEPLTLDSPPGLITLVGSDSTIVDDLVGGYVQDPATGHFTWIDGPLITSIKLGIPFLIDEIGLIEPRVLSVIYPLMDGRGVLNVTQNPSLPPLHVKKGWFICAAYNPQAPGVNISEALLDRFHYNIEVETDWSLAVKLGVPSRAVDMANLLSMQYMSGEIGWSPQMRTLLAYRDDHNNYGTQFAVQNLLAKAPEEDRPAIVNVMEEVKLGIPGQRIPLHLGGQVIEQVKNEWV